MMPTPRRSPHSFFRSTVTNRARQSPGFVAALVVEAMQAPADGDMETARTLLRDVANATRRLDTNPDF